MATDQPATPPVTWAEAQPLLRPVLRPQSYANRLVNDGAQPWVRPVFPLINEMVVVDLPAVRAMVTPAETGAWGITGDQAFTVARENLTARQQILTPGEKYLLRDTDGDSYIDSMVLATGWLGSLAVPGGPGRWCSFPATGRWCWAPTRPTASPSSSRWPSSCTWPPNSPSPRRGTRSRAPSSCRSTKPAPTRGAGWR